MIKIDKNNGQMWVELWGGGRGGEGVGLFPPGDKVLKEENK